MSYLAGNTASDADKNELTFSYNAAPGWLRTAIAFKYIQMQEHHTVSL